MPKHIPVHQIFAPAARPTRFGGTHIERLFNRIDKKPSGCWEWTGSKDGRGYGRIRIGKELYGAHRAAYEIIRGPIPDNLSLDHLCRNPLCVNPAHLEPVTHEENMRRSAPATKTHCVNGHERTPENTYTTKRKTGKFTKACSICARASLKRWYLASKEKVVRLEAELARVA